MKKPVKILILILIVILFGVFCYSGYQIYSTLHEYKVAENTYDELSNAYVSANADAREDGTKPAVDEQSGEETIVLDDEVSPIDVDFDSLKAQCEDVVGWLYCPNTVINYPVTQTDDNMYYLHRLINGNYNASGTLFVECLCPKDFKCDNTIIYGHHMNDGSMFAKLENYKYQNYYDENPVMYLNTPTYNYRIELFAGYTTSADSDTYIISFADDEQKQEYLDTVIAASNFTSNVDVTVNDKIITLSTCSYDYDDARYVVQGKLVAIH